MDKSVCLIIAKGDSKRIPNKNAIDFNGKPMFLWNVLKCLAIFDKTYVSSDYDFILDTAKRYGAIPIKRPRRLCGNIPNIPVYQHAYSKMKPQPEAIVAVQANSPTIEKWIIEQGKDIIENTIFPINEFMTVDERRKLYGSVWAIRAEKLMNYGNPYKRNPDSTLIDISVDIHYPEDIIDALKQIKI